MPLNRRTFLGRSAVAGAGVALGGGVVGTGPAAASEAKGTVTGVRRSGTRSR